MRQRLGTGDPSFCAIFMRCREDFFRGDIGNAVSPVSRYCTAAQPEVIVCESDTKIGAGPAEVKRRLTLFV
jgi:hypothetical protein